MHLQPCLDKRVGYLFALWLVASFATLILLGPTLAVLSCIVVLGTTLATLVAKFCPPRDQG